MVLKINDFQDQRSGIRDAMKPLKAASFIFSPLLGAFIVGYLLLRFMEIPANYFALIVIAGLILSLFNGVMLVISVSKGHK
jgi:hypothetical protein